MCVNMFVYVFVCACVHVPVYVCLVTILQRQSSEYLLYSSDLLYSLTLSQTFTTELYIKYSETFQSLRLPFDSEVAEYSEKYSEYSENCKYSEIRKILQTVVAMTIVDSLGISSSERSVL